ncbi:lipoyl amidotransferase LIPT1, mitochondrial-like [Diadema antillarum]|uniref:lipoyl amidotransferase LIPT1, mitochondrial-like n=1 Tax=Diadema antillarum TaxID=105358 RepID=UPI003A8B6DC5
MWEYNTRNCQWKKLSPAFSSLRRFASTKQQQQANKENVTGLVYLSTSSDVFCNLAFEDWVYNNTDLSETSIMLLWRNDPCVVIGRHQNPWAEVNLRQLWSSQVKLARRRSGGGTVYHDLGNLNITFFTSRERYNRSENLNLISRAIQRNWPHLSVSITERDAMVVDNFFKISGTSSKLGRKIAYHHCTLLHSVNTHKLKALLNVSKKGLQSNATASVRSTVKNLADIEPAICHTSLIKCISNEFYSQFAPYKENQIYKIDPKDEATWNGLSALQSELESWQWVYGKTPRFSVTEQRGGITVIVHVHHAKIEGVVVQAPDGWLDVELVQRFTECLHGQHFWSQSVADAVSALLGDERTDHNTLRKYRLLASMIRDAAS